MQGVQGVQGDQGLTGLQGLQGIQGGTGPTGPPGPQGANGADGAGVSILGSYNTVAELVAAHPTGNVGDAYLVGGNLYVWSANSNAWLDVGNIQGPQGQQGIKGDTGPTGPQGQQGPQGAQGPEGPLGPQGLQGIQGPQGDSGATGPQGIQGIPGQAYPFNTAEYINRTGQSIAPANIRNSRVEFPDPLLTINPKVTPIDSSRFEVVETGFYRIYYKFIAYRFSATAPVGTYFFSIYKDNTELYPQTTMLAHFTINGDYETVQDEHLTNCTAGTELSVRCTSYAGTLPTSFSYELAYIQFEKIADY
jgi:hypothetical protein